MAKYIKQWLSKFKAFKNKQGISQTFQKKKSIKIQTKQHFKKKSFPVSEDDGKPFLLNVKLLQKIVSNDRKELYIHVCSRLKP